MTRVKLCGLMTPGDVGMAVEAGADALGFVTEYPISVPWNLDRQASARLAAAAPPFVTTVAVVGGAVDDMLAIARAVKPHFLQLHGDESADEVRAVCEGLRETGAKAIKALRIDVDTGRALFEEESDPVKAALALAKAGVAGLVVDSKTASRPAGTGVALDWSLARKIRDALPVPMILAGGLNAANVGAAVAQVRPYGVDVISGVESAPGTKDPGLARAFVRAAKEAQ